MVIGRLVVGKWGHRGANFRCVPMHLKNLRVPELVLSEVEGCPSWLKMRYTLARNYSTALSFYYTFCTSAMH